MLLRCDVEVSPAVWQGRGVVASPEKYNQPQEDWRLGNESKEDDGLERQVVDKYGSQFHLKAQAGQSLHGLTENDIWFVPREWRFDSFCRRNID